MNSNTILLLGKNGQLGRKLLHVLKKGEGIDVLDSPEIDFCKPERVIELIEDLRPRLIINAVAYTDVNKAEIERDQAYQVNAQTVGEIAKKAKEIRAALFHFSTDFVFDGKKRTPYLEEDQTNPINQYGKSKLLGEEYIQQVDGCYLILRLSWLYSIDNPSFVTRVLNWSRTNKTIRLVDDQIGSPTSANMVAKYVEKIIRTLQNPWNSSIAELTGKYHLAGSGAVSRFEWGKTILEFDPNKSLQVTEQVLSAKTADFPSAAERPVFSALNCRKITETFDIEIPDWKTSLKKELLKV